MKKLLLFLLAGLVFTPEKYQLAKILFGASLFGVFLICLHNNSILFRNKSDVSG